MNNQVSEKPVVFRAPDVLAILSGSKTQFRRVTKPEWEQSFSHAQFVWDKSTLPRCPYGYVGDRLWVKEVWKYYGGCEYQYQEMPSCVIYQASPTRSTDAPWKPASTMPRWASRITLEITGVRVQRLSTVTIGDINGEGVNPLSGVGTKRVHRNSWDVFIKYWDKSNPKNDCDSDPFVWAITFKKV